MGKARPKHRCTVASTKAAMFRSNLRDVSYKVCIKFPSGTHPNRSCASKQAVKGVLYYNIVNSNVPGLHRVTWFVKGSESGGGRSGYWLPIESVPAPNLGSMAGPLAPMLLVGFDTATDDTAVCAWRDGEVLDESLLGSVRPAPDPPRDRAAGGDRAGRGGRRGLGGGRADRGRPRPRLLHRAADRDRHRAGAGRGARHACGRGRHARRARPGHAGGRRLGERQLLASLDARRGQVFAALYDAGGQRLWGSRSCRTPRSSPNSSRGSREAPLAAGSGAVRFRHELLRQRRPRSRTTPTPSTGSPRGTSALLAAAMCRGGTRSPRSI